MHPAFRKRQYLPSASMSCIAPGIVCCFFGSASSCVSGGVECEVVVPKRATLRRQRGSRHIHAYACAVNEGTKQIRFFVSKYIANVFTEIGSRRCVHSATVCAPIGSLDCVFYVRASSVSRNMHCASFGPWSIEQLSYFVVCFFDRERCRL